MAELLIDEGIGQDLAQLLRAQGLPAFHALEFLPKGSSDALVFLEAQTRALTIFTWNRDDYALLAEAWRYWGHGAHHGVISRPIGQRQLPRAETYRVLEQYWSSIAAMAPRLWTASSCSSERLPARA